MYQKAVIYDLPIKYPDDCIICFSDVHFLEDIVVRERAGAVWPVVQSEEQWWPGVGTALHCTVMAAAIASCAALLLPTLRQQLLGPAALLTTVFCYSEVMCIF